MEEDMAFVRGLVRAGVPSELHVYPGGFHGFARFAPNAAVSRQSVADFTAALARLLRPGAPT
jgi:triacylglycerol lipase